MSRRLLPIVLVAALATAACGDDGSPASAGPFPESAFAFAVSTDLGVGPERLLVAIGDDQGSRLASPEIPVTVTVHPEGGAPGAPTPATFMWALPGHSGLYRVGVEFTTAGIWWIEVTPDGGPPLPQFPVSVRPEPMTPAVGTAAPRSDTPTADQAPLAAISTDDDPDPRFYELSIAEAVASGRPTVIVFATPRFCTTGVCGPTLDDIKALAPSYPGVNFIHVEVFTNLDEPDDLALVPAVLEWGLPTEPWIFVVDDDGIVIGRFEGVVAAEELEELLG